MEKLHLNCDLGEGGAFDAEIMPLISACNIACGGHAGDKNTMETTVALANANNVEIGAHPSYPDKENFGRKSISMNPSELKRSIREQILSLYEIAKMQNCKLTHIKPHGALYNDIAKNENLANLVVETILEFEENWTLYVPYKSEISKVAKGKIKLFFEAFADRNYNEDHSLVSRQKPHAMITKKEVVFEHIFRMFSEDKILTENGIEIPCFADTFCLHSDTPNSVGILQFLHKKFRENKIEIKAEK